MRRAILLGLLQGPTEMAPVSSSAHTALLQRLWGGAMAASEEADRQAAFQKSLEVALHGGTAIALALRMSGLLVHVYARTSAQTGKHASRKRLAVLALSLAPPALAGGLLERPIERHLGGPRAIATGLTLGAAAMAFADRGPAQRTVEQADLRDGIALGVAQAAALAPGVSRRGATLAAARMRGFTRHDADMLSWLVALPVFAGACTLKSLRLVGEDAPGRQQRRALALSACGSFASTLVSASGLRRTRLGQAPLWPFSAYRLLLAVFVLGCEERAFTPPQP